MLRVLIADAYPAEATTMLLAAGARPSASEMFPAALAAADLDVEPTVLAVAAGERLGHNVSLGDFDGIAITGSPLAAFERRTEVERMIGFARAAFESGVPVWGSCFGLQVMSQALGGEVRLNPKGYEVGIARRIEPNTAGVGHPLFEGKPAGAFDAIAYHTDEVCRVPSGATVLASNAMSEVQAIELERDGCHFWGVQYHPEYDLANLAKLLAIRADRLVDQGLARTREDLLAYADDLAAIGSDPSRRDIAWRCGIGPEVYDQRQHGRELANWVTHVVSAARSRRESAGRPQRTAR